MPVNVEWLLKGEPRAAQIEAVRRSYYGEAYWDQNPEKFCDAKPNLRSLGDRPHKGWGHFLQMRLGKTPTFLNEFMLYRRDFGYRWGVVLTPPKFKLDWPLEADRFGCELPTLSFDSSRAGDALRFIGKHPKGGLIAINYEALRYKKNLEILQEVIDDRTLFGTDESVNIKNPESMYTKAALALGKDAGALRIMSGKPVIHSPYDYWSQLRFIHELDGFNQYAFRNTFCKMGGFQGKKPLGVKNEERLFPILDACSWAPRRVDWMETFGIDYVERMVTLPSEMLRMYRQMQEDFLTTLHDGTVITADQIVGKLLKMQQISSGFLYDEFGKYHELCSATQNPKIQEVIEILKTELPDNEKLLVFTCFTPSTEMLWRELEAAGYQPAGIRKGMGNEELITEKNRFNNDPACRVFIANGKSVKYGNTLMGTPTHPCTAECFFENWYSLDDRAQCEERPQGAGQITDLTVFDLMATPHDRVPIRALQRKEDVSAAMMRYDRSTGILPPKPELNAAVPGA